MWSKKKRKKKEDTLGTIKIYELFIQDSLMVSVNAN